VQSDGNAIINIRDNSFNPTSVTILAGKTVTWNWTGSNQHNVTFDNVAVGNSVSQTTGTFPKTFATAGTFTFYCSIHGKAVMTGTITVQ